MQATSQAVQFPNSQTVACSELFKAFLKLRSICCCAGLSIIGKDLLAAELLQRGALHAGVLILGRYPSVAVFHGSILGQTYGTLQPLISLAAFFVSKPTLCET